MASTKPSTCNKRHKRHHMPAAHTHSAIETNRNSPSTAPNFRDFWGESADWGVFTQC